MEYQVLSEDTGSLKVRLDGIDRGLLHAIVEQLQTQKGVTAAAQKRPHPLKSALELFIQAKDPKKELATAIQSLDKQYEDFKKQFA